MKDIYSQTKILLVSSKQESFGLVIREALLNNITVICTELPGTIKSSYNLQINYRYLL